MSARLPVPASRSVLVDGLKALASQLIVLHHLAFYGPMAGFAAALAPTVFAWLADEARMVVQIFLVIGGFMATKALAPNRVLTVRTPWRTLQQRFVRLVVPYWYALALAVTCSALARHFMDHPSISAEPTAIGLLANVLLLQDIVGHEAFSAGAWYVAIDLQLFFLMLFTLGAAKGLHRLLRLPARWEAAVTVSAMAALTVAGLFFFNLDAGWSMWALYFAGSYGLGALAFWASDRRVSRGWLIALAALGWCALHWHWRDRLLIALCTALLIAVARRWSLRPQKPAAPLLPGILPPITAVISSLGTTSYALFLVHFPMCLVVNALFNAYAPHEAGWQLLGVIVAWTISLRAARIFHDWVEAPAQALTRTASRVTAPAPAIV